MTPATIVRRTDAIRFPRKALAEAANLHEDTVERVLNDKAAPRASTLEKLEKALCAEERRLARYLVGVVRRRAGRRSPRRR